MDDENNCTDEKILALRQESGTHLGNVRIISP